jgi:hypothetical protein
MPNFFMPDQVDSFERLTSDLIEAYHTTADGLQSSFFFMPALRPHSRESSGPFVMYPLAP